MRIRMFLFVVVVFVAAGAVADDLHHYWDQVCGMA
ncbi:hypothetical protein N826_36870 [Skermanella aerolata KACC 11604]|nr:hypothetical protein N826_36870 [Skermanella aerolata KACC 11604]